MNFIQLFTAQVLNRKNKFRRQDSSKKRKPVLVIGVTAGASAFSFFRGQLAWFREQGWDVVLVTNPGPEAEATAMREKVRLFDIPMERGISPYRDIVSLFYWVKFLAKEQPRAVNVGTPKAGMLGILAAWLTQVPVRLYVVRGLRLEGSKGITQKILWLMEWMTIAFATDVLFVSESLYQEAKSRKLIKTGKSWLIGSGSSNGVDSHAIEQRIFQTDKNELRMSLGLSPSDFIVGFIGRISHDKGAGIVLDAIASHYIDDRVKALLIGAVEDRGLGDRLKAAPENVKHLPWSEDVWSLLSIIDVLCLPTIREGFPNVVLEAASAGIPTITTRATGAIDSVRHDETGILINVGDISSLIEEINKLVTDPDKVISMGSKARMIARTEFQPEIIWQGLYEIITSDSSPVKARKAH